MKVIRTITTKKEIIDIEGWTIPKGTKIHIMDESLPKAPKELGSHRILIIRVDNGTGILKLCPKTHIKNTDLN